MPPMEETSLDTASSSYVGNSLTGVVSLANDVQDRIVSRYFEPYSVTFTYWALAFVFLYIGLQKVVPHRSAADVQLATIGGLLGYPYIAFVTVIGAWQMLIGALFLLRRLRLCAWFFFSYQFFTFGTLVVLRKIVFQPPWLTVAGVEIPWALGAYAAFILKNLVFAAVFFVLAAQEMDTNAEAGSSNERFAGDPTRRERRSIPSRLWDAVNRTFAIGVRRSLSFARVPSDRSSVRSFGTRAFGPLGGASILGGRISSLLGSVRRGHARLARRGHSIQDHLVGTYFRPHGVSILYYSYGFIFFYFGFQKPSPAYSPVRDPLAEFLPQLAIPLEAGMLFIGLFEMFLGLLFFFKEIRIAFWLFFGHQAVTLLSLAVIPFVAFQPPYVLVFDRLVPWALTGYGAFVIKNVVFIAGFTLLASIELRPTLPEQGDTPADEPA